MLNSLLAFSPEVKTARDGDRPLVALESSVISHGLPWPINLDTAVEVEMAVRSMGATPATIAVIDGVIRVGTTRCELERLAHAISANAPQPLNPSTPQPFAIAKASARDLPWLVARGRTGATTVAGTIFIAHRAGISIMATGGIGGVHRGATETWDVSADLIELSRTPVAVVCSGPKAILDLSRTIEFLETHGVPVIGFGTDELPAFFSRSSGLKLDCRVDTPQEAAEVIARARQWPMDRGIVFANPPPAEHAISREEIEQTIEFAIAASEAAGVRGKAVTPFLLDEVRKRTGDRVLTANRALLVNNARLAAQIAVAIRSIAE